jgi:hypothetical protein
MVSIINPTHLSDIAEWQEACARLGMEPYLAEVDQTVSTIRATVDLDNLDELVPPAEGWTGGKP